MDELDEHAGVQTNEPNESKINQDTFTPIRDNKGQSDRSREYFGRIQND